MIDVHQAPLRQPGRQQASALEISNCFGGRFVYKHTLEPRRVAVRRATGQ